MSLVPLGPHQAGLSEQPVDSGRIAARPKCQGVAQRQVSGARIATMPGQVAIPKPVEIVAVAGVSGLVEQRRIVKVGWISRAGLRVHRL